MSNEASIARPSLYSTDKRGLWCAFSFVYFLLSAALLFLHPPVLEQAIYSVSALLALFPVYQFGSRLFASERAMRHTAALTDREKSRLRTLATIVSRSGLAVYAASGISRLISGRSFRESFLIVFVTTMLCPAAFNDLVGDPQVPADDATLRLDWSDSQPIHSDCWGRSA